MDPVQTQWTLLKVERRLEHFPFAENFPTFWKKRVFLVLHIVGLELVKFWFPTRNELAPNRIAKQWAMNKANESARKEQTSHLKKCLRCSCQFPSGASCQFWWEEIGYQMVLVVFTSVELNAKTHLRKRAVCTKVSILGKTNALICVF
jgi:hypothetical protein